MLGVVNDEVVVLLYKLLHCVFVVEAEVRDTELCRVMVNGQVVL